MKAYFRKHTVLFHIFAAILWIWGLSLLFVILWGILISLHGEMEYILNPRTIFPKKFRFSNYAVAIRTLAYNNALYPMMVVNSVWFSFGATFLRVAVTTMCAYAVSKYEFRGKKLFYGFIVLQLMLPVYGQTVANYKLLTRLGLVNTPLYLLALGAGHGMYFLIMHSYFENLSKSYMEAARIDGANDFVIFLRIMLPMAKPLIFAMFIAILIGVWNDFTTPLLYLDNYPTLASGLYRYKIVAAYTLNTPVYFAGILLSALPMAALFITFNKTLMQNLTIGGIKG